MDDQDYRGLILTRRRRERVFIRLPDGRDLIVQLIETKGTRAVIRFEAPADIKIFREELLSK
jgi:sRNA-binding carbon storage regulator CsrA